MPALGPRCGELRIPDAEATWRILYRQDADAVVMLAVFAKKTQATQEAILETCATRLKLYDLHTRGGK
jgi:phage-related protein